MRRDHLRKVPPNLPRLLHHHQGRNNNGDKMLRFLDRFWDRFKEKDAAKLKKRRGLHNEKINKLKGEVLEAETEMLSRNCPINNNDKCFAKCTHFKNGHILPTFCRHGCKTYYSWVGPKCKLWAEN